MSKQPKNLPKKAVSNTVVIGVDCRLGGLAHAGIGRYILNVVERVPLIKKNWQWKLLVSSKRQAAELIPNPERYPNVECVVTPYKHYSFAEQLYLPGILKKLQLDLLHVPHFNVPLLYTGKLVVTIHDLLWHEHTGTTVTTLPPWLYWPKYLGYRAVVAHAVHKSNVVIVPTKTIQTTLSSYYPAARTKTVVTYEGSSLKKMSSVQSTVAARLASKKLVYVGSLYPHKNVSCVISALTQLPEYTLTIIGSRSVFADQIQHHVKKLGLSNRVTFTGYVTDAELATHLSQATALVQPSLSEGFGLTGLEAMSSGVPLIASDIPIFREVYQDGAFFFDPHSPDSCAQLVRSLRTDSVTEHIQTGLSVASKYSWDTMAEHTISAYEKALQE